ncbi:MAG TPA: MaoC family dehydratase N-terminal domain-containing protein [Chloroflexota bacterium]|nr:MaoC family dehydratase N-terminal domain-containing protein [Chloroflexota bacterium]
MTVDRSIVGATSEPVVFEVERGAIRKLVQAIGDPNPVFQAGDVAPPTFPTTFRVPINGLQLDLSHVLHAGEEYVYERPIRAGDRLTCVRRIADVYVKEGRSGTLTFLVSETEGRDPDGRLVFTARSTVIVR